MALISLNGKDTSEAFRLDDNSIIYVDTITGGSRLTLSDNKVDTRNYFEVEETPAAIAALTTKLLQITDTNRSTVYINLDRVVEVKNSGDSDSNAVLVYDDNGDEFKYITINQTIASFITSYNTQTRPYKSYKAIVNQSGTAAPTMTILENTIGTIVWTYFSAGLYVGTLADAFTNGKTLLKAVANRMTESGNPTFAELQVDNADNDVVYLNTYIIDGSNQTQGQNNIMLATTASYIEIYVFE